ncbi:receptor-interacting serine/threonine-protein kinase 2-like isoform X2 [Xenopus laevis]|nr:receptor-interacting serine/threonine-protein kinase 2-like isoform X2 [Xenopus laevis]
MEFIGQLKSERLVQIFGVYKSPNTFGILTDWMENGSLHSFIHQRELYPVLPVCVCVRILSDIAEGLHYLHNLPCPVMHRTLKPSNIHLDAKYHAKISKYGLLRMQTSFLPTSEGGNKDDEDSIVYLSPDRLKSAVPTLADDTYSFGIIAWEMFSRKVPFQDISNSLKLATCISRGLRPQPNLELLLNAENIQSARLEDLTQFVNFCWHQDPHMRPSMTVCFNHFQRVLQNFSSDMIQKSVDCLIRNKERAEQTLPTSAQEFDIRFLDISCSVSNSKSVQRSRAQSVPDESQALLFKGLEHPREQRSASLPATGKYSPITHFLPTIECQNPDRSHCYRWSQRINIHSASKGFYKSESCAEILIKNRESILNGVTEGQLNKILDIMRSSKVLSRGDYENINSKMTLTERARECLDMCCGKGEEASRAILETLGCYRFS